MKVSKSFMNFAENVIDSLQAVSEKIDEVQAKMDELQETMDGSDSSDPAPSEEKSDKVEETSEEPTPEVIEEKVEETKEESAEEPKEFSEGYIVVKNLKAPYGNVVVKTNEFSEEKHQKVFNKVFSSKTQAQAMMSMYSFSGKNFSNRYRAIKNTLNF